LHHKNAGELKILMKNIANASTAETAGSKKGMREYSKHRRVDDK